MSKDIQVSGSRGGCRARLAAVALGMVLALLSAQACATGTWFWTATINGGLAQLTFPTKALALQYVKQWGQDTNNVYYAAATAALQEAGIVAITANSQSYRYAPPPVNATPGDWNCYYYFLSTFTGPIPPNSYECAPDEQTVVNYYALAGPCNTDTNAQADWIAPTGSWSTNTWVEGQAETFFYQTESRPYAFYTQNPLLGNGCATTVLPPPVTMWRVRTETCPTAYPTYFEYLTAETSETVACNTDFVRVILTGQLLDCPKGKPTIVGDPCDVSNGDFSQTEPDYSGATDLTFTRYYHSAVLESHHALGVGWTHNYAGYLVLDSNKNPLGLLRPDGHTEAIQNINGEYVSLSGDSLHLVPNGSNWSALLSDGSSEVYSSTGQLTQLITAGGQVTTLGYNSNGQLASVTGPFGHSLQFTYNSNNQIASVVEPDGVSTITYAYDGNNNLISATYPDNTSRQYLYQNSNLPNNLTGLSDESGTQFLTVQYDSTTGVVTSSQQAGGAQAVSITYNDNTAAVVDSLGTVSNYTFSNGTTYMPRLTAFQYGSQTQSFTVADPGTDPQQRIIQSTDANGNATGFTYDNDHLLSETDGAGAHMSRTTSYQYLSTSSSLPTLVTGPLKQTGYSYFSGTNLVQTRTESDPVTGTSRSWNYTYDTYGRLLTARGPRTDVNSTTTYTYNTCTTGAQCGQVATITDAAGNVTTYGNYNADGSPLSITDPNGVVTSFTYDARQRVLSRSSAGEITTYTYYPTGLLQTVTLPDGSTTSYTYDGAHRLTKVTDSAGNSEVFTLDGMGNRTSIATFDPQNVLATTQSRVYNSLSQLAQTIGAAGTSAVTTSYSYDADGNEVAVNAPLGRNTSKMYDALNRLSSVIDPNGGLTTMTYDASDRMLTQQDPLGLTTSYQYNGLGDVLQVVSPTAGATSNTYDSGGNLITSQDARGAVARYSYDALDRLITANYGDESIAYAYDSGTNGKGRLSSIAESAESLAWQYDGLGRVTGKTESISGTTLSVAYSYANGDLATLVTPSGQSISYTYSNHQISSIAINGTPLLTNVQYQPFSRLSIGWTWGNGATEARLLDNDGNASQFSGAESTSYTLDSAFRIVGITNQSNAALSWTYGYDNLDRLTSANTSATGLSWTYDGDGNRSSQSGTASSPPAGTWGYDNQGRAVTLTAAAGTLTQTYDGLGERVQKVSWLGTTLFAYDEAGHLIGEYDGSGNLIQETVWLGNTPVATLRSAGSGAGISVFYIHADHLNSPKVITRPSDGTIVWRWDNDPFGTAVPDSNPSQLGTFIYNLRFPGQYADAEDGLAYNMSRDYDPTSGRYVQSDPIGLGGGINTYAYASGNPVSFVDSKGTNFTYSTSGNTITINATITIYGPNASDALAQMWQAGINSFWNNRGNNFYFGKCKIAFNVKVTAAPNSNWWFTAPSADNYVYVDSTPDYRSNVRGGWYGRWSASAPAWEAAHETGHLFDLPDDYTDDSNGYSVPNPGHEGHMMAQRGARVVQHEIDDILNRIRCQCGQ